MQSRFVSEWWTSLSGRGWGCKGPGVESKCRHRPTTACTASWAGLEEAWQDMGRTDLGWKHPTTSWPALNPYWPELGSAFREFSMYWHHLGAPQLGLWLYLVLPLLDPCLG